jgi:hypothetical protein
LVIADLTNLNPNAFYEIGRHMAQKPIIHMFQVGQKIPFDVSLYRSIGFSRARPADLRDARTRLAAQVNALIIRSRIQLPMRGGGSRLNSTRRPGSGF